MLKKILLLLLVAVAGLAVYIHFQPADIRVVRSTTIEAPAAEVFAQVNDLHKWEAWSPWAKLDPKAAKSFDGAEAGEGAKFKWSSDNFEVGEGSMTIVESKPNELVKIKLEFTKPFAGVSTALFTFQEDGSKTNATWEMRGTNNFLCKAMCLVMNMDKELGGKFEAGLRGIKEIVERKKS